MNLGQSQKGKYTSLYADFPGKGVSEVLRYTNDTTVFQNQVLFSFRSAVAVGDYSSTASGHGVTVNKTCSAASHVYADDNGVVLAANAVVRAGRDRMLLTHAGAANVACAFGRESQLRITADISAYTTNSSLFGGHQGYCELVSGATVLHAAGLIGTIDVPTGATVASSGHAAGLMLHSYNLGGTITGLVSGIYVPVPGAGTWSAFLDLESNTGMTQSSAAGSSGTNYLKVYLNGVLHTIAMAHN